MRVIESGAKGNAHGPTRHKLLLNCFPSSNNGRCTAAHTPDTLCVSGTRNARVILLVDQNDIIMCTQHTLGGASRP
eukprot:5151028-Pyramimonas_sp.AAC.1